MYGWHGGWGMSFFGPLFMVFVIGGIVALTVWLVRGPAGAPPQHHRGRDPVDILKERFARGEIDKDEFEERRKILER
ncbi:MAG: SHOCT domain-containing protein [Alphaproteobacteria bacterium]|nr:SHOCT domain-containing protein [Alphaproteobacteria bacterium]